jgi:hypothetical protein
MDLVYYRDTLARAGVSFEPGLKEAEVKDLEDRYKFTYPPDLREFLMFALPVSKGFLDWRNGTENEIVNSLLWPYVGMCFDIEHNSFWPERWGERPASFDEACQIAKHAVDAAPTLIPIAGHRYIPDRPHEPGNPVFSVHQTDIIYYGGNLANYLENEFAYYFERQHRLEGRIKSIEFWSWLVEDNA